MYNLETEKQYFIQGYKHLGGIDEAGRGPLAGPVVAACVVCNSDLENQIKSNAQLKDIKDSKKISEKKREALYDTIMDSFASVGVGICDHETIDRINILQATFLAMKKAIGNLKIKPDFILLDGKMPIPNSSLAQKPIIQGDNVVFSIAAASIIAKVTRDRIMRVCHEEYPEYDFDKHKGYGTKKHMEALNAHGPCPIHRQSFAPVKKLVKLAKIDYN